MHNSGLPHTVPEHISINLFFSARCNTDSATHHTLAHNLTAHTTFGFLNG